MTHKKSVIIATRATWGEDCANRLHGGGWSSLLVRDGFQTLTALAQQSPAALVLDANLDDIESFQICRKIAAYPPHAALVLFLVANDDPQRSRAEELEGSGVVCLSAADDLPALVQQTLDRPEKQAGIVRPIARASRARPEGARPLFLLVDDDPDFLDLMTILFRPFDVDLLTTSGGREALFIALEAKPDVVITDYSMPDGNADYLLTEMRREPSLRETPVVVLTAWTHEGQKDAALERNMTGRHQAIAYLQKPLEFDQLLAEVEQYCDIRPNATVQPDAVSC